MRFASVLAQNLGFLRIWLILGSLVLVLSFWRMKKWLTFLQNGALCGVCLGTVIYLACS